MQFDPTLYVITDSTYHTTETLLHAVDQACAGGATLIQLREKDTAAVIIWLSRSRSRR